MKIPLEHLIVLFVDCQTTGANPEKGNIIEIGWARSDIFSYDDSRAKGIATFLVKLSDGKEIPKRVQSVTGICTRDVASGHDACDIWKKLLATAEDVARTNQMEKCPAIIHFAKFEEPFLHRLHEQSTPNLDFPLLTICTHEIARRLFPCLPRRGIRAIAGYFGFSIGEYRRCANHVAATSLIWREVVRIMKEQHNISTLEELQQWLDSTEVSFNSDRVYPMETRIRRDLPDAPGVYRMLRSNGDVLYIGKASSLKERVNSYFRKRSHHPEHILEMLSQAKQLDVTETESALEAAVLESDEIKLLSPPYNIALRKRERDVWFCATDFEEFNHTPNRKCKIGPLTSHEPLKRLAEIKQVIKIGSSSHIDENTLSTALGIPTDYAPDAECGRAGFEIFLKQHAQELHHVPIERALTQLGQALWLQRLAEKNELNDDDSSETELENEEEVHVWTPELVARAIESNVLRGTREIRRARWLVLLSESSLVWEATRDRTVLLVFAKGRVVYRESMEIEKDVPVPPGYRRKFIERQQSFDLMTIDRMRVVTTEIRKIVSAGRWINLRLSPNVVLDRDKLTKMLKWI